MSIQAHTITWRLSPKQRELFESGARFRVAMGGRRFGKNEVETAAEVDYALNPDTYDFGADTPENVLIWHVAPTYRQSHRHGYKKVLEKLPEAWIEDKGGSEYGPSHIELNSGAEIEFLSYDNPEGLQGEGVDLLCGDEWAYSDSDIWDADLRPMLLDSGGGAILISKPLGENHFYQKYVRGATPDMPYGNTEPRQGEWYSIHATSYDNPFVPREEIDSLRADTPDTIFQREYMANPTSGGTLLTRDMLQPAPATELESTELQFHIGVDVGVQPDSQKARETDSDYWAAAIIAHHKRHGEAFLVDVARKRGMTLNQGVQWLQGVVDGVPRPTIGIEQVQAQRFFLQACKEAGLPVHGVDQSLSKEDRIIQMSVPFERGDIKLVNYHTDVEQGLDDRWQEFVNEWLAFPEGRHIDLVDATEIALRDIDLGGSFGGISGDLYGRNNE